MFPHNFRQFKEAGEEAGRRGWKVGEGGGGGGGKGRREGGGREGEEEEEEDGGRDNE